MKNKFFTGKVAVVTGAAGLLCSEISAHLAAQGAKVALIDRDEVKLLALAEQIEKNGGICTTAVCDVLCEESMQNAANALKEQWGVCHFLINGAGGNSNNAVTTNYSFEKEELQLDKPEDMRGFFNLDLEVFGNVLKINTMGTVIPIRVFASQMVQNGGGVILNFASMNSYRPLTRVPAYAMSKAAVVNLTQWLATYFGPAGIRVNAVAPGFFINERSKLILGTPEEGLTRRGENVIGHTPMQRFGKPQDLLGCVDFLLNDEMAAFVTGITMPVDGGFLSHSGV